MTLPTLAEISNLSQPSTGGGKAAEVAEALAIYIA
jgi:hypothetical protein